MSLRRRSVVVFVFAFLSLAALTAGCFSEQSFPLKEKRLARVSFMSVDPPEQQRMATREWGEVVHRQIEHLLPPRSWNGLTSDQLRQRDGRPIDVGRTFGFNPAHVDRLLDNHLGLTQTAQVIPVKEVRGRYAEWPETTRVAIPMPDGTTVSALLAPPTSENPLDGSYLVVMHGLFGRQYGYDQQNTVAALRRFGHHVLAVEMRGHGMTETANPSVPMTFGIDEPRDLLAIDRWLRETRGAKRVGLIGWSLTAHQALLAAWVDSDPSLAAREPGSPIFSSLPKSATQPAFDAGMLLFSPAINVVEYTDSLDTPRGMLISPVRAAFQDRAAVRLKERGATPVRRMWAYVEYEMRRSAWMAQYPDYESLLQDVLLFIDFTGSHWRRLERVRVPVLVVQAADDPVVGSAQAAVNLFAPVKNENCCLILTRDGGHAGFAAASSHYVYSLMQAFFDPATGPRTAEAGGETLAKATP